MAASADPSAARPPAIAGATLSPISAAALPGWGEDRLLEAVAPVLRSCAAIAAGAPELRLAAPTPSSLEAVCRAALADPPRTETEARAFFMQRFDAFEVTPSAGPAFFTGYFEPEIDGSPTRSDAFPTPMHARPHDLATRSPFPTRREIEDGALDGAGLEILWLRDPAARFIVQVQGSARVRLPDGSVARLRYAGRNGRPYTSIGRILIETGRISREEMSLERLMGWLRAHPDEARAVMHRNESYIFFARDDTIARDDGPIGGAGVNLTPERSIAIDRSVWPYGLPIWIGVAATQAGGAQDRLQRLMVAQDTGSAIVGPARVDVFFGSGDRAGTRAGLMRHPGRFVVFWPKPQA